LEVYSVFTKKHKVQHFPRVLADGAWRFVTHFSLSPISFSPFQISPSIRHVGSSNGGQSVHNNGLPSTCPALAQINLFTWSHGLSDQRADFSAFFLRIFSPLFRCVP
jgi:hypothetical protein